MQVISLADAMVIMKEDGGQPFTVTFVTADRKRPARSGKLLTFENVYLVGYHREAAIIRVKLPSNQVRAIHTRLITRLNQKKVIY